VCACVCGCDKRQSLVEVHRGCASHVFECQGVGDRSLLLPQDVQETSKHTDFTIGSVAGEGVPCDARGKGASLEVNEGGAASQGEGLTAEDAVGCAPAAHRIGPRLIRIVTHSEINGASGRDSKANILSGKGSKCLAGSLTRGEVCALKGENGDTTTSRNGDLICGFIVYANVLCTG
jgi:hypothetical protein